MAEGKCQICGAQERLTKHHLVPQRVCRNKYKAIKNEESNLIWICDCCHRTIHAYYNEQELRDRMSTLESLLADAKFSSYVAWRKKHLGFKSNSTKLSNSARR